MKYYYDVVLSFAGEDREYVEECADILTALGIKVFYDSYEQDVLWGKDLYTFLADIYSNKARYAIVFISQHYVKKCWTKHEFKFINERMFNSETEYLLPVFLDDTKLCGIPETQGYLTNKTPYEVAVMFAKKINKDIDVELMKSELQQSLPTYEITVRGRNVRFYSAVEEFDAEYPLSFLMELYKLGMLLLRLFFFLRFWVYIVGGAWQYNPLDRLL